MKGWFSFFEQRIQFLRRIFLDLFLNMQIVFRHVHIRVPRQALNGFQRYALGLKLRNISVPAAMWGKNRSAVLITWLLTPVLYWLLRQLILYPDCLLILNH